MNSSWIKRLLVILPVSAAITLCSCGSSLLPPASPVVETSVVVTPATATILRGQTQQFMARVLGSDNQTVTWHATEGTIDSSGLYTAPADADEPLITITAISKASPVALGSAVVTLPSVTLSVAPGAVTVGPGLSHAFTATVTGLADTNVNWTVEGSDGGTITNTGLYTAPSVSGVYTVTATLSADAIYIASALAVVTAKPSPFSPTGNLVHGRQFHTATLLPDGRVLVAGGGEEEEEFSCIGGTDFAELYNPVLGSFALTSPMTDRRYAQTSTLLQNGKVLITGGFSFDASACDAGTSPALASAELYDPSSGSFAPTGTMSTARGVHSATLLSSGKVLIVGGGDTDGGNPPFSGKGSATAEVYDPVTGTFTPTANMSTARIGLTATLLLDGKVLIAGGVTSDSSVSALATAELYDPSTGAFTDVGTMTAPRAGHAATPLSDGKVLITGGITDPALAGTEAEVYDPATASFLPTSKRMALERWNHTATLLPDGTVLLLGGGSLVAEIYSPSDDSFSAIGVDGFSLPGITATLLKTGDVVIISGTEAELYQ